MKLKQIFKRLFEKSRNYDALKNDIKRQAASATATDDVADADDDMLTWGMLTREVAYYKSIMPHINELLKRRGQVAYDTYPKNSMEYRIARESFGDVQRKFLYIADLGRRVSLHPEYDGYTDAQAMLAEMQLVADYADRITQKLEYLERQADYDMRPHTTRQREQTRNIEPIHTRPGEDEWEMEL